MFYGSISITRFLWSDWRMRMQWIPGPFSRVGRGLGTRLGWVLGMRLNMIMLWFLQTG